MNITDIEIRLSNLEALVFRIEAHIFETDDVVISREGIDERVYLRLKQEDLRKMWETHQ